MGKWVDESRHAGINSWVGREFLCKSLLYMELSVLVSKSWEKGQKVQKSA